MHKRAELIVSIGEGCACHGKIWAALHSCFGINPKEVIHLNALKLSTAILTQSELAVSPNEIK